jgi:hypothetical protein
MELAEFNSLKKGDWVTLKKNGKVYQVGQIRTFEQVEENFKGTLQRLRTEYRHYPSLEDQIESSKVNHEAWIKEMDLENRNWIYFQQVRKNSKGIVTLYGPCCVSLLPKNIRAWDPSKDQFANLREILSTL